MSFIPETPRWFVIQGREGDARDDEIREIKEVEREEEGGLGELTTSWVRSDLIVAIGLAVFQQIIVISYALTVLITKA